MPIHHMKASTAARTQLYQVLEKHHPHLADAMIALEFVDSKAYIKDRLNLGKVSKFSKATQLWFPDTAKYDFCITLCIDVWTELLDETQCEALLDLNLSRCQVEYEPETVIVNGKTQVVRDEYGRTEYTNDIKHDDEGQPIWKVSLLDVNVLVQNIKRYGLWYEGFLELKTAIDSHGGD